MIDHNHLTEKELIERLSQIRCLKIELQHIDRKLRRLEQSMDRSKSRLKKLLNDGEDWETIAGIIEPIISMYQSTKRAALEYLEEYRWLTQFIHDIPDSRIRTILTERYIDGRTWQAIAFCIGEHDEQYPRRMHNRFIAEYVEKYNNQYQI